MAKRKSTEESSANFEESLLELQGIVQQLEGGNQGLEVSLQQFERGIRLLRECYQQLDAAEQKIELLVGFNAEGEAITTPFDATATADLKAGAAGRRSSTATSPLSTPLATSSTDVTAVEPPVDSAIEAEDDGPTLF